MELERLSQLLDAYGAEERHWPSDLRAGMRAALDAHPEARQQLFAARDLDLLLDSYQPAIDDLMPQILDAVPPGRLEQFLDWLLPENPGSWWRPALAGATPFVIGIAIGIVDPGLSTDTYDSDWEVQERALLIPATAGVWYE